MTIDRISILRELAPYIAEWLAFQGAFRRTPGIQAAIRVEDEVVLDVAWGHADLETGEDLTTKHLFRIASHSKTMTATAIMQLVEAGTVRLDDTAARWIPQLEGTALAAVTVRELLGHQGGVIRDGVENNFWQRGGQFLDRDELIAGARTDGAVFATNEFFKYSNIGYSLLGLVIEAATGTPYNTHVAERIADRLGLADSGPEYDPARSSDYAAGHTGLIGGDDARRRIAHVDTRAMAAATGWYSTARDLTTYGAAHWFGDESLLTDASKRLLQREESRVEAHGKELGRYGLGFDLRTIGERDLVGHSGGYPGHITRTWIDPHDRLVVSVLTNSVDGPADALATGVVQLIDLALDFARELEAARPGTDRTADPSELARYTGRFANMWGVTDIVDLGGRLVSISPRGAEPVSAYQVLDVVGEDEVATESVPGFGATGERVAFERDASGAIEAVTMGGMTMWPIETYSAALASGRPGDTLARMSL
jgi:CubicO group peptidase (beta-lactamase class C family)